jgi:putative oxidoreductase
MRTFPFISLPASLVVMRVCVAALFIAHAVVRMANGSIPGFGTFLEKLGFPAGVAVVWVITTVEIVAGTLMAVGWHARWMASALFVIAAGGILLIHRHLGWFVGEHGTGGSEYSVSLMVSLLVIATADRPAATPRLN